MVKKKATVKNKKKRRKKSFRERKAGAPPGSLVYSGDTTSSDQVIHLMDHDPDSFQETRVDSVDELNQYIGNGKVTWIDVVGLKPVENIGKIGSTFGLHPLLVEDILNTGHRPKFEMHGDLLFMTLKMLDVTDDPNDPIREEQVSIVLGKDFVISFQQQEGDVLDPIRQRIRNKKGIIRDMGADHLFYALLDSIVDRYFIVLEYLESLTEELESTILETPESLSPTRIQEMKREMIGLRRSITPLREAVGTLLNSETELITKRNHKYFRDVHDHLLAVIGSLETQRELVSGMMDTYMSSISTRMNNIMKVLTVIASIFIPLTFLAGVYGMNFEYMPELKYKYGYFVVLGVMALILLGMIIYFKRKKWL